MPPIAPEPHVIRTGEVDDGLPVVLVHGGMDRSSSFGRVARQLGDVPLVRYDRRGYGRSADLGVASLSVHVDDLLAVIDETDVVVFGHSVGGVIALAAAQRRPDRIRAVCAYEAPTPWRPWWPRPSEPDAGPVDPAEEAERFMRRMIGDRLWERLPARTRDDRRAEGPALLADLEGVHGADAPFDIEAIVQPVLSATGSDTTWWHRRAAEEIADGARSGELVVIDGASHGVHLSHPRATADLVRRLRALGSAGSAAR